MSRMATLSVSPNASLQHSSPGKKSQHSSPGNKALPQLSAHGLAEFVLSPDHDLEKCDRDSEDSDKPIKLKGGGSDPLVEKLRESIEEGEEECLAACEALEAAAAKSCNIHRRILAAGGADVIVHAMHEYRDGDMKLQVAFCQTLQHLASATASMGATVVADAGACKAIANALSLWHSEDALVVQAAAHALELIAFGGPRSREHAVKDGALEALLGATKKHKSSAIVQQAVLAALQTLVENNPNCQQVERVAAANGIQIIVTILGDHNTDKQVQYWGRLLIQNICEDHKDLKAETLRKLHYQGIELEL